uniref:Carbohydrate-binding domain-containing protein n=1 Tax=candidate division WOR-3 bacterium TaxID=2052148 RepID=A0A7V3KPS4_UNCW3
MWHKLPLLISAYLFLSLLQSSVLSQSREPATKKPSVYLIKKVDIPPQIDGKLDDPCWEKARCLSGFTLLNKKGAVAKEQTKGYLVYDNDNLYLGVECFESEIGTLKAVYRERDTNIWEDDCIEVFIDTRNDQKTYFQFIANSLGAQFDMDSKHGKTWNGEWKVKTSIGEKLWSVELAIPFDTLNAHPEKGTLWRFNLCRERYAGGRIELSAWSNTGENFHTPALFGYLIFDSLEEQIQRDIALMEKKKEEILNLLKSASEEELKNNVKQVLKTFEIIKNSFSKCGQLTEEKWFSFYSQLRELLNRSQEIKSELEFSVLLND